MKILRSLLPALMLMICSPMWTQADEPMKKEPSASPEAMKVVKGDVMSIEGEFYVVKDVTGHEVRMHVNKDTKMGDNLKVKVGDKVEAHVGPDGHAQSITLQIPDIGKGGQPRS